MNVHRKGLHAEDNLNYASASYVKRSWRTNLLLYAGEMKCDRHDSGIFSSSQQTNYVSAAWVQYERLQMLCSSYSKRKLYVVWIHYLSGKPKAESHTSLLVLVPTWKSKPVTEQTRHQWHQKLHKVRHNIRKGGAGVGGGLQIGLQRKQKESAGQRSLNRAPWRRFSNWMHRRESADMSWHDWLHLAKWNLF